MTKAAQRARTVAKIASLAVFVLAMGGFETVAATTASAVTATSSAVHTYRTPTSSLSAGTVSVDGPSTVLLLIAADGPGSSPQTVSDVHGCGLDWTLERRANDSSGTSEIWTAQAHATTGDCVPVAALEHGPYVGLAAAYVYPDAYVQSSAGTSGTRSAPAVVVDAVHSSVVLGVGNDWLRAADRDLLSDQQSLTELQTSTNDTMWVQRADADADGPLRVGTAGPRGGLWNFAAVEIASTTGRDPVPSETTASATPTHTATSAPAPTPSVTPSETPLPAPTPTTTPTPTPTPNVPPVEAPPASPPSVTTPPAAAPAPAPATPTGSWPSAASTGVPPGVALRPSGPIIASTPGQVIDGLDISGAVVVKAPGVIIRNSRIHGDGTGTGVIDVGWQRHRHRQRDLRVRERHRVRRVDGAARQHPLDDR